ncbi:MAG: AMP-binding protein [Spirochaetes bacterium]|nr:AMP-binding protein [Spirochaetota bacterium]
MFIKDHGKNALVFGEKKITYSQLQESIKDYSWHLSKNRGKHIAIFMENCPEWIYTFFAVWNIGAVNVLIDVMSTAEEVTYIINDCTPSLVIYSDKSSETFKKALKSVKKKPDSINISKKVFSRRKNDVAEYNPSDDEIILMLYTSGTTGNSKGVMLSKRNVFKNIYWNNDSKRINSTDVMIAILPNHHSWPLMATVLCPLECGATTVLLKELRPDIMMKAIKENKITMITAVPRLFEMFHNGIIAKINKNPAAKFLLSLSAFTYKIPLNRYIFGRVKVPYSKIDVTPLSRLIFKKVHKEFGGNIKIFISGGAKLNEKIIHDFRAMGLLMVEGYGLTETAPMVTYHPFNKIKPGSVGVIFDEIDYRIEKDGEILIKGPNITKGYWNKKEETKAVFTKDGYFKTGDLGYVDKERYLFITGRKKDIIILPNGKNIRPDLIEEKLKNSFPYIEDVVITEKNSKLFAIIIPDFKRAEKESSKNINDLIKWEVIDKYNSQVENYKKIQNFIITREDIPKTRMGKIKRHELKSFIDNLDNAEIENEIEMPLFEEYKLIVKHIQNMYDGKIHPKDHLEIDLGLDSISIMELELYIENVFGINFKEHSITEFSTVIQLADFVKENKKQTIRKSTDWKTILQEEIKYSVSDKIWLLNLLNTLFRLFYAPKSKFICTGKENIPEGACILAPNHTAMIDSLFIYSGLTKQQRKETYFYAKEKHFKSGLRRFFANRAHVIIMDVNKNLKESLQEVAAILRKNKKIVIYPEGTRTTDGKTGVFKNTFAILSKELNVPVIPVAVDGLYKKKKNEEKPDKTVKIHFLPVIYPGKLDENTIAEKTYNSITEIIGR